MGDGCWCNGEKPASQHRQPVGGTSYRVQGQTALGRVYKQRRQDVIVRRGFFRRQCRLIFLLTEGSPQRETVKLCL